MGSDIYQLSLDLTDPATLPERRARDIEDPVIDEEADVNDYTEENKDE